MNKNYRILEFCLSDGQGGLELYMLNITSQLRSRGHVVYSITRPGTFLFEALQGEMNQPFERPKLHKLFFVANKIACYFEARRIDIVHLHWGYDLPLVTVVKRLCKRPVKLIYSRQMQITKSKRDPYHWLLYSQLDLFTAITRKLLKEAQQYLPMSPGKIDLLRYGITPADGIGDCESFLRGMDLSPGWFSIGCFSRIEYAKGQHLLLEALSMLSAEGVEVQAVIVGHVMDPAYRERLEDQIQGDGLGEQLRFMDFIKDPMKVMPCFDVIVLPTFEETFGLVLVEAMSMGVAVIGSRAGGVPEIIDHGVTGLMFESGNSRDLASTLRTLHRDPELRKELATRGCGSARENYSDGSHMERLEEFFARVIAT
ncbi:MAG: glycosyltransferase family 4 protein [Pseudomonadota bacterium]